MNDLVDSRTNKVDAVMAELVVKKLKVPLPDTEEGVGVFKLFVG